jgi:hypothetical protein
MLNSILNFFTKKPILSLLAFLVLIGSSFFQIQHFSLDASSESLSLEEIFCSSISIFFVFYLILDKTLPRDMPVQGDLCYKLK